MLDKKIEKGVILGVSDNDHFINNYIEKYMQRFLEYEVKEDQKDFPPFMKAEITKYWASSSFFIRTKKDLGRNIYECKSKNKKDCNYKWHSNWVWSHQLVGAENVKDNMAWLSSGQHGKEDRVVFRVTL